MNTSETSRTSCRRLLQAVGAFCAMALLVACAEIDEMRDPTVSNLVLDPNQMTEVNSIRVPMPLEQAPAAPQRAEASSLWDSGSTSFFRDRRAAKVGDLVTVLIDINDRARLQNASERSRSNSREVKDPDILNFDVQTDSGSLLGLESDSTSSGEGSIQRNESIRLRVAALIIRVLPNGNFVLAGRQEVKVNAELRELRIAGIIRQADINVDNTVDYDKIAEARITYGGRGQISNVQKPRYGDDLLEIVLPY
ncbi:flagellar basal body L-ring protein FlgH [uncultured Sulfitobacter sp.]|uniref:flagellar basal body L-ring protein FlgH n=1 Tax=uncultured Sulfitobacter sp. TaxID=191468 RepID=UPI002626DE40|nr:flagellar basal body L-ring protein FlgH [uncultured Sulfitobacter sp.]